MLLRKRGGANNAVCRNCGTRLLTPPVDPTWPPGLRRYAAADQRASSAPHLAKGGAEVTEEASTARAQTVEPKRVYVEDFKLEVAATEQGGELIQRPRILREVLSGDPAAQAKQIVDQMAVSLVKDLDAAGVPAQRLEAGAPLPKDGWLVRGVFT